MRGGNAVLRKTLLMLATSLATICASGQVWAACDPDYSGVTLTVASQTGPYIASALKLGADAWTKKTCGKVNVVEFPWSELYPKIATSLTSGDATFDLISFAPAWLPDFVPYLSEMPKDMQSGKDWDDIEPAYRERLMVWEGKI
jgi:multiple sugar transport system substrate-binding protein